MSRRYRWLMLTVVGGVVVLAWLRAGSVLGVSLSPRSFTPSAWAHLPLILKWETPALTVTPSSTPTFTSTSSPSATASRTATPTRTRTVTATRTRTSTVTQTATVTVTPTESKTPTITPTPTITLTPSRTPTATRTPTPWTGCTPGLLNSEWSDVSVLNNLTQVTADGLDSASIVVTLVDDCGATMPDGTTMSLASSRGTSDTISPPGPVGIVSGLAFFVVTSTVTSDFALGVYTPSVFTATSGTVVISDTANLSFVCVSGAEDASPSSQSISYLFTNVTNESRQLSSLTLSAVPLIDPSRHLIIVDMLPSTIWSGSRTGAVITIDSGWTAGSRTIASAANRFLILNFDFDVTIPGEINTYTLQTQWQDIANLNSVCSGNVVVVTRGP